MSPSTPASRAALFARVYREAQRSIGQLLRPLLQTLEELGCGPGGSPSTFDEKVRRVLTAFAHDSQRGPTFASFREPVTPELRQRLISDFLYSLGVREEVAQSSAQLVRSMPRDQVAQPHRAPGSPLLRGNASNADRLSARLRTTHRHAQELYRRLAGLGRDVNQPYGGFRPAGNTLKGRNNTAAARRGQAERFADAGVEQTVGLLEMFPDLAEGIYRRAGLAGLTAFPPQPTTTDLSADEAEFLIHIEDHLREQATWDVVSAVALLAAGVALTVVTAGVAGPLIGMAAGATIGLAQGGMQVANASAQLTTARDGHRMGAVGEERLAFLEGEVQGAWGMLVADVATGGLMGRFGGAGNVGRAAQAFRTIAISGVGAGMGTATNPNVWNSPDVVGVLFKATVLGAAAGGAGTAAAGVLSRAGSRLMIGLGRSEGALAVGRRVTLSSREGGAKSQFHGEVTAIDGETLRIATPHGEVRYRVDDVALVRTADGSPADARPAAPQATSRQPLVNDRAPRVHADEPEGFDRVADLERPLLGDADALAAMSNERVAALSEDLMPRVQSELAGLGYRTRTTTVTNETGGEHTALEILEAPGRLGTLMRRAGPTMGSDVRYIYDPVGLRRDGGTGLFDDQLNAIRMGHGMFSFGHRGHMSPFFHELRHGRTMLRLGDPSYAFNGKLFFGRQAEMTIVARDYRDQFQLDEMYAYLKQAGSSNAESSRANQAVAASGRGALQDPRTSHSFGTARGEGDAYHARDFARAVKEQVGDMLDRLQGNAARVSTSVESVDGNPTTIHKFLDEGGRPVLNVEYFHDGQKTVALVVKQNYDAAGKSIDETHVLLMYELPGVPRGYAGDAAHSLVVQRMQAAVGATDEVIAQALAHRTRAQEIRDAARDIYARAE